MACGIKIDYEPLGQAEEDLFVLENRRQTSSNLPKPAYSSTTWRYIAVTSLFINSLLALYAIRGFLVPYEQPHEVTRFAHLARNVPKPWSVLSGSDNQTEEDRYWDVYTNYDRGNIALDDNYAKSMGLPRAQRFPWDLNKGIYLINAYHNLHCIQTIRTALVEFRTDRKQSSPWPHVRHCLHVLRDEIMCNADDTPRYTGYQPNQKSGLGQERMCRDWSSLERWADEHTACWRHVGDIADEGFSELERYRFCPDDSPYKEISMSRMPGSVSS